MKRSLKTIGLLGGMGWESSKMYYEHLNRMVNKRMGGAHSAKVILNSVDFAAIKEYTLANDWKSIETLMVKSAQQLERAGADLVLLCSNLIHKVSPAIKANISIPFLHIADATGEAILHQGISKVLLLGTKPTMEGDFYSKILLENYGLKVQIPNEEERDRVHKIIYEELLQGKFLESSKKEMVSIMERTKNTGIEGVIMGCTELSLFIQNGDLTIPMFDTGKIHAQKAADWAVQ